MVFDVRRPGFRPQLPQNLHHLDTGQHAAAVWGILQVLTQSQLITQ